MSLTKGLVIRSSDELNRMGELGKVLKSKDIISIPNGVPVVYQFSKGKNGESVGASPDKMIGEATNIRIDPSNGDLVGDVEIYPFMRLSDNFRYRIDNLVVSKVTPVKLKDDSHVDKILDDKTRYELVQLIVYDKLTTKSGEQALKHNKLVEKTYNAPTEVYEVSPGVGEKLAKFKADMNAELETVTKAQPWKGDI